MLLKRLGSVAEPVEFICCRVCVYVQHLRQMARNIFLKRKNIF